MVGGAGHTHGDGRRLNAHDCSVKLVPTGGNALEDVLSLIRRKTAIATRMDGEGVAFISQKCRDVERQYGKQVRNSSIPASAEKIVLN